LFLTAQQALQIDIKTHDDALDESFSAYIKLDSDSFEKEKIDIIKQKLADYMIYRKQVLDKHNGLAFFAFSWILGGN